jgi:hypothetical protein
LEQLEIKSHTADNHNTILRIHLENLQVLNSILVIAHVSGHLLSGVDTRTTTLTRTRRTHRTMRQTNTVTAILTVETVSLHDTSKALTLSIGASINKLALLEPTRLNTLTNRDKARLVLNTELKDMALRRQPIDREMSKQRLGHIIRVFPASTNLHSIVTVSLTGLVGDHLDTIQLEDSAGDALSRLRIVDSSHTLLDADSASAEREGIGFAAESRCGSRLEDWQPGADIETTRFGRVEGSDSE